MMNAALLLRGIPLLCLAAHVALAAPQAAPSTSLPSNATQALDQGSSEGDLEGFFFHGHKKDKPFLEPPPQLPLTDSTRFPRRLSPLAAQVYSAVTSISLSHPKNSPVPATSIGTSGTITKQVAAYGETDTFIRELIRPAILEAQYEVFITTLIYDPDTLTGKGIRQAILDLDAQLRQNTPEKRVKVYMAIDSIARTFFDKAAPIVKSLFKDRVEIKPHKVDLPDPDALTNIELRVKNYHLNTLGALHAKMIIVDGKVLLTGSKNLDGDVPMEFMARFQGPVAFTARQDFLDVWDEPVSDLPPQANVRTHPSLAIKEVPMLNVGTVEGSHMVSHSEHNPQDQAWITLLENAKSEILIHSPNFVAERAAKLVLDAVRRGVTVKIITSFHQQDFNEKIQPSSIGDNYKTAKWLFQQLEKDGDKAALDRLRVCWFIGKRVQGNPTPQPDPKEWAHIKAMFVDQQIAMFGTGNMDGQSWYHSRENNVLIDDAATTQSVMRTILSTQQSLQFCSHERKADKKQQVKDE